MNADPVLAELRAVRDRLAAWFDCDVDAIRRPEAHQESPATLHENIFFFDRESRPKDRQRRVLQQLQEERPRPQALGLRLSGGLDPQHESLNTGEVAGEVDFIGHRRSSHSAPSHRASPAARARTAFQGQPHPCLPVLKSNSWMNL